MLSPGGADTGTAPSPSAESHGVEANAACPAPRGPRRRRGPDTAASPIYATDEFRMHAFKVRRRRGTGTARGGEPLLGRAALHRMRARSAEPRPARGAGAE